MLKEKILDGLNPGDRVFEKDGGLVKIRLRAEAVKRDNKLLGPSAFRIHMTAAVCGKDGKALPRADGAYCIFPHTITLAGLEGKEPAGDPAAELLPVLESLVERALVWHRSVAGIESFLNAWQSCQAFRPEKTSQPARIKKEKA
ncbi:MAG TPA: hypothetical protein VD713_01645 [Sphingomonadales bacterium]|nr:hypothetical protein [Sphingomonadales bacterium]